MKTLLMLVMLLSFSNAMAVISGSGNDKGNGGDSCESRFYQIKNDIVNWIDNGGSYNLKLPQELPLSVYNSKMKAKLAEATVECVTEKLTIFGTEKTCINKVTGEGKSKIFCNFERFMKTPDSEQYSLTHHEYAGLAGLETNIGEISSYELSNQLTSFLQKSSIKKLAIKKQFSDTELRCLSYDKAFKSILVGDYFEIYVEAFGDYKPLNLSNVLNLPEEELLTKLFFKVSANDCSWEPADARLYCGKKDVLLNFKNKNALLRRIVFDKVEVTSGVIGVGAKSQQLISLVLTKKDKDQTERVFREYIQFNATFSPPPVGKSTWRLCQRSVN